MQFRRGFILLQWRKQYWIVFTPGDLEFHSYIRVSFRGPHVWHLHAKVTKPKKTYVRLMHLKPWRLIIKLIKSKIYFTAYSCMEVHFSFSICRIGLQPPICVSQYWQRSPRKKGIAYNKDDSFCFNLTLRNLNTVWMFLLKFSYTNTVMNIIVWIEYFQRNIANKAF